MILVQNRQIIFRHRIPEIAAWVRGLPRNGRLVGHKRQGRSRAPAYTPKRDIRLLSLLHDLAASIFLIWGKVSAELCSTLHPAPLSNRVMQGRFPQHLKHNQRE
jgi:hypothetical protein